MISKIRKKLINFKCFINYGFWFLIFFGYVFLTPIGCIDMFRACFIGKSLFIEDIVKKLDYYADKVEL